MTTQNRRRGGRIRAIAMASAPLLIGVAVQAESLKVTAFNFVRAESDSQLKMYVQQAGGIGKLHHMRQPWSVEPDEQPTIRGNRDTLYSMGVFDLTTPVTVVKPRSGGRFQSMMMVNQDGSTPPPTTAAGKFEITQKQVGTRYVWIVFRTFADPNDPADMKAAHGLQDAIRIEQHEKGKLELPDWDEASLVEVRDLLNELGALSITDFRGYFGLKDKLDPVKHLLGAAYGWGGNPEKAAMYAQVTPTKNDGQTAYTLRVEDVPVDGFWSVSVYNKDGFFEKNDYDAYTFNDKTAEPDADGSFTIHFGGDPKASNFLPITDGWNYTVRMYEPRQAILDGTWTFPEAEPVE